MTPAGSSSDKPASRPGPNTAAAIIRRLRREPNRSVRSVTAPDSTCSETGARPEPGASSRGGGGTSVSVLLPRVPPGVVARWRGSRASAAAARSGGTIFRSSVAASVATAPSRSASSSASRRCTFAFGVASCTEWPRAEVRCSAPQATTCSGSRAPTERRPSRRHTAPKPMSTATASSAPEPEPEWSRRTSLTRTSRRPSMSTIWVSRTSRPSRSSVSSARTTEAEGSAGSNSDGRSRSSSPVEDTSCTSVHGTRAVTVRRSPTSTVSTFAARRRSGSSGREPCRSELHRWSSPAIPAVHSAGSRRRPSRIALCTRSARSTAGAASIPTNRAAMAGGR